jgi:thiol-disulfide isomerase/thioredoxin
MKTSTKILIILMILIISLSGCSKKSTPTGEVVKEISGTEETTIEEISDKVSVYFFWGDGCPHCTTQKPFLEELKKKYSDKIEIKMFETWKNPENYQIFSQTAEKYGIKAQGVPTTFIGEKHWVGYSSNMDEEMEEEIKRCIEEKCINPENK